MEQLYLTCKSCGKEFAAVPNIDRATFEASNIEGMAQSCPECGALNAPEKSDYFFR